MIIDDYNYDNKELHKLIAAREEAGVTPASNGFETVDKFNTREEGYFSFIMINVQMLEMNSLEAAKAIQTWGRESKIDQGF